MKKMSLFSIIASFIIVLSIIASYTSLNESKTCNESKNIPAWILVNRFAYSSHPETIIEVDKQDVSKFPSLVEALKKADEDEYSGFAHPNELINCTNNEAKEIIEFLGGEYLSDRTKYGFDIKLDDELYSIFMMFSWKPTKFA